MDYGSGMGQYEQEEYAAMLREDARFNAANPIVEHRLTWRMWHPVTVFARSRELAIAQAIKDRPAHIPAGTELHYGPVGGKPVYVAA